jgi:hypothetical protein
MRAWTLRFAKLLALPALLWPLVALARIGGGEHYSSGSSSSSSGGGDGGGAELMFYLVVLTVRHPVAMIPVWGLLGLGYFYYQRNLNPRSTTRRAFDRAAEAERRTAVSTVDVTGWVNALHYKDPEFALAPFLNKAKDLFGRMQEAWFRRDLEPVRAFMSDATFQRFKLQLELMRAQGIRDAIADLEVLDLQLVGLDQSEWFDTLHVRVKARMRDTDVASDLSDDAARAAARRIPLNSFIEVWSFVRKPGAKTRIGADLYQGKCPNCGAPFDGGAANNCGYCGAVVNSGNYDWVLSEITQGEEAIRGWGQVDGLLQARQTDPALNLEMLEDRTSLIFWRWIEAQSTGEARRLSKLATPDAVTLLAQDLTALHQRKRRKVFTECAVGAVNVRLLRTEGPRQVAHVEVRWSARMGIGPESGPLPQLPTVPQRSMFVLGRGVHAKTQTGSGMATNRCPNCHAPLTDSLSASCDYCGAMLGSGEGDWVLISAKSYEAWNADESLRYQRITAPPVERAAPAVATREGVIVDVQERERLLYMMAAMAAADGVVDASERKLLRMCSERWSIPWSNVEMALESGDQLFDRLVPKGSPEAEKFLAALVQMALIDGKIDRKERRLLDSAAEHLGMTEKLGELLAGR